MVREFRKGDGEQLTTHFHAYNFDCPCKAPTCTKTLIDTDLVDGLEILFGFVNGLWVSSGYRCAAHNSMVDGKKGSFHLIGKAADVQSHTPAADVAESAEEMIPMFKYGGIGRAKNFVHLDVRGYAARWTY